MRSLSGFTGPGACAAVLLSSPVSWVFATNAPSPTNRAAAAADETGDEKGNLLEVTVTARKREESLQEVPLSVVAVSGEDLERRSINDLESLGQSTPNFTFAEQPQSGRLGGIAFIRGVGQRDAISAYDPAVGIYIDGVYVGRMYANNFDMLEIQRVEVLRGPQGTLFGKNTSGGAVGIVTKQPDVSSSSLSGRAQLTAGSLQQLNAAGGVNIPLITDELALQIAGSRLTGDGYGQRIDSQDMSDTNRTASRAQLLFKPIDRFSALLSADWMKFNEHNAAFRLVDTNPSIAPLVALNTRTSEKYDDRWLSTGDYSYNGTGPNSARGQLWGTSLTLVYENAWGTLKSISAYRELNVHNDLDPDGSPVVIIDKFENVVQNQFSQELQVSGRSLADRLDWVVGAYYFREAVDNIERYNVLTALFGSSRGFARTVPTRNESVAEFAQGNYAFTDRLRLTAGLRHTHDTKSISTTQLGLDGVLQFATPVEDHGSNAWSPRVGLDYRWTPRVMTYVSASQGAKNGGFNGRVGRPSDAIEFDDETVWTYESGVRSDLFDGTVRFNATAFYSRYSDLQLQISGSTIVNGGPVPFSIISNVPQATIKGGELEISIVPTKRLTLNAGLGLTYGRYRELPTDPRFVASNVVNKDSEFSHTPKASFTVGTQYTRPLNNALKLVASADYEYKSRIYYNPENTANLIQPGYGLLNGRLTFEHAASGMSVSLFGTNLTAQSYIVGGFDDASNPNPGLGFSIVSPGAPRLFGVTAQSRF